MDYYDSLGDEYSLIEHAIAHLRNYYHSKTIGEESKIDKPTAEIFATFLREKIKILEQYAQEIDEDYAK